MSLAAYAEEHRVKHGPACSTCALPPAMLEEIRACRTADPLRFTFTVIAGYLKQQGYSVSSQSLSKHWRDHEPA